MGKTKIEYCDETLNPLRYSTASGRVGYACVKVSKGCENCYAERINRESGTGLPFLPQSTTKVEVSIDYDRLLKAGRMRQAKTIFWNDMTDVFFPLEVLSDFAAERVFADYIDPIFAIQAMTPNHQHLNLTKRAKAMMTYFNDPARADMIEQAALDIVTNIDPKLNQHFVELRERITSVGDLFNTEVQTPWPPDNVWAGFSVCTMSDLNNMMHYIVETRAARKWLSIEPMLESMNLGAVLPHIHWGVVGFESGVNARASDLGWIMEVIAQFEDAGKPIFVKQLGTVWAIKTNVADFKGGNIFTWPTELRVRQRPPELEAIHAGHERPAAHG